MVLSALGETFVLFHTNMMPKMLQASGVLSLWKVFYLAVQLQKCNKLMPHLIICHIIASFSNEEFEVFWLDIEHVNCSKPPDIMVVYNKSMTCSWTTNLEVFLASWYNHTWAMFSVLLKSPKH